ncbi:MAG TPA: 2Fe-2S iron-sulfur cluster-binding protein, partial [Alphaproteobacteria bacterium]|nr:2Fe-2S iron-sulfur cluster-binding protein [Alphaproteobacteria bacterium]
MSGSADRRTAKLKVRRGGRCEPERYSVHEVPFEPGQSVLDALRWIRAREDPGLAVRFACINANACKECVMRIDGEACYACTTRLRDDGEMLVEPMANKALVRDLVTDTVPPGERLDEAESADVAN